MINLQLNASSIRTHYINEEHVIDLKFKLDKFCRDNPTCIIRGIEFFNRPTGNSYFKCLIIYTDKRKLFSRVTKHVATDDIEKILESGFIKGLGKITIKPRDT